MPYNLRKRKAPEPAPDPAPVPPPTAVKKSKIKEPKIPKAPKESKVLKEPEVPIDLKEQKEKKPKETKKPRAASRTARVVTKESEVTLDEKVSTNEEKPVSKVEEKDEPAETSAGVKNLYMFGADSCGELGQKRIGFNSKIPKSVPIPDKIRQVACGPMHTIALTTTGVIYSFGCNDEGALGRVTEDEDEEASPTQIQLDHKVIKITAGDSHSAALTTDQKVFVWGNFRDEHGSVGLLPECSGEKTYKPIQVMPHSLFQDIASGSNHVLLLDTEGVVYSFGVGAQGQLGRLDPDSMGDVKDVSITAENRDLFLAPKPVNLSKVDPQRPFICDAVFAGNYSSFATNTDKKKNRLAGWGLNNYHQLGYKGAKDQIVQHSPKRSTFTCSTSFTAVVCGQHHTLFLTRTGRLFVAGRSQYGMLGLKENSSETVCPAKNIEFDSRVVSLAAGINTSFAVTEDGRLFSWGMNGPSLGVEDEQDLKCPTLVKRLGGMKVESVSTGGSFTAVIAG